MNKYKFNKNSESDQARNHADKAFQNIFVLYKKKLFFDVTLIAGNDGVRVPANRLILSASSDYFCAMFTSSMRECKDNEITMGGVSGDILQDIVKYCYTGSIEVNKNTVEALLVTAGMLRLETIIDVGTKFLQRQMNPANCLGFGLMAQQHHFPSLLKHAEMYALRNFPEVCEKQEFLELNSDQLSILLKSANLNVTCEEDVFQSLMTWIHHDENNRKKEIPKLLTCISLVSLKLAFIIGDVKSVCLENNCRSLLEEMFLWHMQPEWRDKFLFGRNIIHRKFVLGGLWAFGSRSDFTLSAESYCPFYDQWGPFKKIKTVHNHFYSIVAENKLYLIGGPKTMRGTNVAYCYDTIAGEFYPLPGMLEVRKHFCVAALNGCVYAIGGTTNDGLSSGTVERYDHMKRTWCWVAPMRNRRSLAAAIVHNGRLIVAGGACENEVLATVEYFDWVNNEWNMLEPMTYGRCSFELAAINGYIYAIGGYEKAPYDSSRRYSHSVDCYDPVNNKWAMFEQSLPSICKQVTCIPYDDRLIVFGHDMKVKIFEFDLKNLQWNLLASMNSTNLVDTVETYRCLECSRSTELNRGH